MFQSLCCLMSAFGLFCGNKIPRWLHNDKEHNNVYIYTHHYTYIYTYYIYTYIYIISFIFNIYIYVHRHLDKMNLYVLTIHNEKHWWVQQPDPGPPIPGLTATLKHIAFEGLKDF